MRLDSLSLQHFRTYRERRFAFDPQLTIIIGANGTGKTNLLEAVYTLLQGQSFRDHESHLTEHGEEWWRLDGIIDGGERSLIYQTVPTTLKQIAIEGGDKKRFSKNRRLPVVLFEPDQLLLLHGSPGSRRRYLDQVIGNINPLYGALLARYERILQQRNNILKKAAHTPSPALTDQLFAWDIPLVDVGTQLATARQDVIHQLNDGLGDIYSSIAGRPQAVRLEYESNFFHETSDFGTLLTRALDKDRLRGFTSVGPHRDDIRFHLNDKDAALSASRGEVRSIMYSMKRRELVIVEAETGIQPIFLMDDLYSELDQSRQSAISQHLPNQTIITSTALPGEYSEHLTIELD